MKSIQGIYGGTFDPIHLGHLQLIETLLEKTVLQSIRIVPCHIPAHRPTPHASAEQRLNMIQLATASLGSKVIIDDYEIQQHKTSYTIHTIEHLKKVYPETTFILIIGADAWQNFSTWHQYINILEQIDILVVARDAINPNLMLDKHANVSFFNDFHSPISSTLVRSLLLNKQDCSAYLPKAVYDYILENKLY